MSQPENSSFYIENPVVWKRDAYFLRIPGRQDILLSHGHGGPVRKFVPGWRPVELCTLFHPLWMLIFRHENGDAAVWYIDPDGRLGPSVDRETSKTRRHVTRSLQVIRYWIEAAVKGPFYFKCPPDVAAYYRLPELVRKTFDRLLDEPINGLMTETLETLLARSASPIRCIPEEGEENSYLLCQEGRVLKLPRLQPGWTIAGIDDRLAPMLILQTHHETAGDAYWYVDWRGLVGDSAGIPLHNTCKDVLVTRLHPLFEQIWQQMILGRSDVIAPPSLLQLPAKLLNRLLPEWWKQMRSEKSSDVWLVKHPDEMEQDPIRAVPTAFGRIVLESDKVFRSYTYPLGSMLDGLLTTGKAAWRSPLSGQMVESDGFALLFARPDPRSIGGVFAYRFVDRDYNLTFYVLCGEGHFACVGLYFPDIDLLVSEEHRARYCLRQSREIGQDFMRHVLNFADDLYAGAVRRVDAGIHVYYGHNNFHIGHYIWQDLSGLDKMLRLIPDRNQLPRLHFFGEQAFYFGPEENIFPEFDGRIDRHPHRLEHHVGHFYRENARIIQYTDMNVSARLGRRVIAALKNKPEMQETLSLIEDAKQRGQPIIVLGIRAVNRTVDDVAGYACATIERMAAEFPGCTIILDGNNDTGDRGPAVEKPALDLAEELLVAAACRDLAARLPVHFHDLINRSAMKSIAWCQQADCFIAPWGAALAKYRWICNTQGLVFSSVQNLRNRSDLSIYHRASLLENSSPLEFVDPDDVTDLPGRPLGFENFTLNLPRVLDRFSALVRRVFEARR